ncbi:NAD(P)-binding protein [Melanomma pulvis-pyrius CBS 109.77]|uniref:NAD(P)-binding protein n=1 Tax=Melanomma pulvis-pyrius CBS 109.77 TaxID=1314802 RepID=A0A6A6WP33_9PLEO|nr:NAD(P)-binding protein [Melanomma pulvis-pyrius CBS 109.77]
MVSWAVTGATRGIGFGYIDNLSADPNNQVFALIRSLSTAGPLQELAGKRKNVHIVVTDLYDIKKLGEAAAKVSKATGGSLDVLILNAGSAGPHTNVLPPTAFIGKEEALEKEINENMKNNILSPMFVINSFLELVRKGQEKKIIFISSPSGDLEFTRITGIPSVVGYSAGKAGMNIIMTKFGAELAPEGIKTLSMSPGWVATDAAEQVTGEPEVRKYMLNAFHKIDPTVTGPTPVAEAVASQLKTIRGLTAENSGKSVGRFGNNDWF